MKTKNNSACRIFAEQLKMLLSLPNQKEAKNILYQSLINSYNQFENQNDNQTENQNEYAYVSDSESESLSYLGESILNLLSKNIVWKEFSNNYGGKRENSGRRAKTQEQEDKYKFEGRVIKLNYKDYYSFAKEYPHIDLDRELEGLDKYYAENNITDWWMRCKNRLKTKETKAKEDSGWHVEGSNW